jgi:hypothetical protein
VGYADGGDVEDPMKSYGAPQGGLDIPTEMEQPKGLQTPGAPGTDASKLGVGSQLKDAAGLASSLYSAGSAISSALPAIMAFLPFSDERVKDGMQRVGQLDNGLPVYKYSIGDGPTQIGLSAQEAGGLHPGAAMADDRGILHLDYDRATRAYGGGLDPRAGYAEGGGMSDDEYAIRTIATEASGKSPEEARAIARVIENRRATGRWGDSYRDVVTARNQFEPWNNPGGVNYPMRIAANDPRLAMAREAFATRLEGEDPTGGALHFYAPTAQAQLARTRGDRVAVPSWARDREYTDLGPTRFVRGVDDPRASGLMAYAGQPQRSEASGAINQAAGQPAGLGAAATTTAPRQRGFIENLLPTKRDSTGEETTDWKKILIPALTGLGAMASSPSLYAGSAVLQGLGAGAQAYSNLEKREADIAQTQAGTAQTQELTSELIQLQIKGDLFDGPRGPEVIMPGGRRIPAGEWDRLGRPPTRSAARETRSLPQTPVPPVVGAGAGAGAGAGTGAGAVPAGLPKEIADVGDQNYAYLSNSNLQQLAADKNTNDPFTFAADAANKVYGSRMQSMQFAKALSDLPAGGKITSQIINPLKERALNLLTLAGVPAGNMPDLVSDVSAADIAAKVRNSLATANVRGPAVEELNKVFAAIPSEINSKEGQAQLVSSFLVDQQEARERARMFNDYRRYMENKHNLTPGYSLYSGRGLNEAFEAKMRAQYQDDKKQLASMFQDKFYRADKKTPAMVLDGQPATVMSYLISNSGRIPDKGLEKALISKYGETAIRRAQQYFGG